MIPFKWQDLIHVGGILYTLVINHPLYWRLPKILKKGGAWELASLLIILEYSVSADLKVAS